MDTKKTESNGREHRRARLQNGNDLVLVEVGGAGGGGFYSPTYLRTAEIERDTKYTKINAKNVRRDVGWYKFNYFGGRGEKSFYAQQLQKANASFDEELARANKL